MGLGEAGAEDCWVCCGVRGELEYEEDELELAPALLLSPYVDLAGIVIEEDILSRLERLYETE